MMDQQSNGRGSAVCLAAIVASTLILTGCGRRSVSGTYVAYSGNQAELLQITETPHHRLTGSLRGARLESDGSLTSSSANVSGSVYGSSITLTVLQMPQTIGQNVSGTVAEGGIDLTMGNGAQTGVEHFSKGDPSDFVAAVAKLNMAGRPIVAARQRRQRVDQLDSQVNSLAGDLNQFVANSHEQIEKLSRTQANYKRIVTEEKAKLDSAQRSLTGGLPLSRAVAYADVQVMDSDRSKFLDDDLLDREQIDENTTENNLNARIAKWRGTCLDGRTVKVGDITPDMGTCKLLSHSVAAYAAVLPTLHSAFAETEHEKAHCQAQLTAIWQAADKLI